MENGDEIERLLEIGQSYHTFGLDVDEVVQPSANGGRRRRRRSPSDNENKRLERMLKNRISAQQARDRKKAYLNDLEERVKELETKNAQLQQHLSNLHEENQMLRKVLKNTTVG